MENLKEECMYIIATYSRKYILGITGHKKFGMLNETLDKKERG
jgi:hypothetical protein